MKTSKRLFYPLIASVACFSTSLGAPLPNGDFEEDEFNRDHRLLQSGEIKLGTSGGWQFDFANGYCCGGTLGALIEIDGEAHILSSYHVLAADLVPGGNGVVAEIGDPVVHPALTDSECALIGYRDVASLSGLANPLYGTNLDAATAKILSGEVDPSGEILGIGLISNLTASADIGQEVKKSGRTTGLTYGSVVFIDATVSVAYDDECAGFEIGTGVFDGQILVGNPGGSFLEAGDSGSLLVEDKLDRPRAIGLLFAGSQSYAVANPIGEVLAYFGATMVGLDGTGEDRGDPEEGFAQDNAGSSSGILKALAANRKATTLMFSLDEAIGHGVGVDEDGVLYVAIFVEVLGEERSIPAEIDGVPLRLVATGRFLAY